MSDVITDLDSQLLPEVPHKGEVVVFSDQSWGTTSDSEGDDLTSAALFFGESRSLPGTDDPLTAGIDFVLERALLPGELLLGDDVPHTAETTAS